jgi:hypothetical protein
MRTCAICRNPKRDLIDKALQDRVPLREIAGQFGTSKSALQRHKAHMIAGYALILPADKHEPPPPDPFKLKEAAQSALAEIVALKHRALNALDRAEELENNPLAVIWFKELRATLELLVKTRLAEAKQAQEGIMSTGSILNNPEWWKVQGCILSALVAFPKAKASVVKALLELEETDGEPGFPRVTRAVQEIIDREFEKNPEPEEDRRPPSIVEKKRAQKNKAQAPTKVKEPMITGLQPTRRQR